MSRGAFWWICLSTAVVSLCCAAIGAIRWLGPTELVQALAPLGRAPLFVGTVAAHCTYFLVQSRPGGRAPVWLTRPPFDGWSLVLASATLCAALASFPVTLGGRDQTLLAVPFVMISTFFLIDRMRRVQRQLAQPS